MIIKQCYQIKIMKISYGLTVWNEDKQIEILIKHLKDNIDINDEIVVVYDQNRVTNEVKQVLKLYENYISYYPFNKAYDNYLEYKNYLGEKCTGDYIFQIDADEIPQSFLLQNIKEILKSNPVDLILVPRINTVSGLTDEYIKKWGWRVNEKGWVNFPDSQKRIYKNDPSIKWSGQKIHGMVSGYKTFVSLPLSEEWCLLHPKTIDKQLSQVKRYQKADNTLKEKI